MYRDVFQKRKISGKCRSDLKLETQKGGKMPGLGKKLQKKIYEEYRGGSSYTKGRKYQYSIQYNPIAAVHTWIIGRKTEETQWYWIQPLDLSIT